MSLKVIDPQKYRPIHIALRPTGGESWVTAYALDYQWPIR